MLKEAGYSLMYVGLIAGIIIAVYALTENPSKISEPSTTRKGVTT